MCLARKCLVNRAMAMGQQRRQQPVIFYSTPPLDFPLLAIHFSIFFGQDPDLLQLAGYKFARGQAEALSDARWQRPAELIAELSPWQWQHNIAHTRHITHGCASRLAINHPATNNAWAPRAIDTWLGSFVAENPLISYHFPGKWNEISCYLPYAPGHTRRCNAWWLSQSCDHSS